MGRSAETDREGNTWTARKALAELKRLGSTQGIADLDRYGIVAQRPFGVAMREVKALARRIGVNHGLAAQLWKSGHYEAQLLTCFVADPQQLTRKEMNAWARSFDNWAIVDTICFHLFDRSRFAWTQISPWAKSKSEFVKRAAFALLWSLSVHDKSAKDSVFVDSLAILRDAASDDRHFVKKSVSMAIRAIGKRNEALRAAALGLGRELSADDDPTRRWIGKAVVRDLEGAVAKKAKAGATMKRATKKRAKKKGSKKSTKTTSAKKRSTKKSTKRTGKKAAKRGAQQSRQGASAPSSAGDPTMPLRAAAGKFAGVDEGTACTQASFKVGKKSFLFVGPQGGRFKAMFKLTASTAEAVALSKKEPDRYEVGSTGWVTARFSAEQPMPKKVWQKWLTESYEAAAGPKEGSKGKKKSKGKKRSTRAR